LWLLLITKTWTVFGDYLLRVPGYAITHLYIGLFDDLRINIRGGRDLRLSEAFLHYPADMNCHFISLYSALL